MKNWIPEHIDEYIEENASPIDTTLYELYRETHLKILIPHMISSRAQGVFLQMISQLIQPKNILEVGTFTGYSGICLSRGLLQNGTLHTIDINEELRTIQEKYFEKAGILKQTKIYTGNALDIIPTIDCSFELAFLDADKRNYIHYLEQIVPKMTKGGIILADNVLWWGKVADAQFQDKDTQALRQFNAAVQHDSRLENMILPLRDGILMMRKIGD